MKQFSGKILEILINANHQRQAILSCPSNLIPKPGQFLQAHAITDKETPIAHTLFPSQYFPENDKFMLAAPIPESWQPGSHLILRGPMGNGFQIEETVKRLGLIALDDSPDRILALAQIALEKHIELALFTDSNLPQISHQIEANPLSAAGDGYRWADMIAIDSPALPYDELLQRIHLSQDFPLSCPTQILLHFPMPCAGLAECGVCAIRGDKNKSFLACEDGPVFELSHKGFRKLV